MLPKLLALLMMLSTMLGAGLQVDRARLIATLRSYDLLAKALAANFVVVPLLAWALLRAFDVRPDVASGILLMAMAPGVPFLVNSGGRKQGGSLAFALEIAFLFSALSVVTIPITAALLVPAAVSHIPAGQFIGTLLGFQLVPLLVGAWAASRFPEALTARLIRALHLVFLAAGVLIVVLLAGRIADAFGAVYGFGHFLIIATLGVLSAAVGWLLGGPDRAYRRTLAIGTMMRNVGLTSLIAVSDFANSLVAPTVITYFLITFVISLPIRGYFRRTRGTSALART